MRETGFGMVANIGLGFLPITLIVTNVLTGRADRQNASQGSDFVICLFQIIRSFLCQLIQPGILDHQCIKTSSLGKFLIDNFILRLSFIVLYVE